MKVIRPLRVAQVAGAGYDDQLAMGQRFGHVNARGQRHQFVLIASDHQRWTLEVA